MLLPCVLLLLCFLWRAAAPSWPLSCLDQSSTVSPSPLRFPHTAAAAASVIKHKSQITWWTDETLREDVLWLLLPSTTENITWSWAFVYLFVCMTTQRVVNRSGSILFRTDQLWTNCKTRSSADADNRLDAFSGQSRSTNMVPFHM